MITPQQRTALLDSIKQYLDEMRGITEEHIGGAWAAGRQGIAELSGAEVVESILEESRIASLVQDNFDLIVTVADQWMASVQNVVSEGFLAGNSPVTIRDDLLTAMDWMPGNWSVIARDQVAKAQLEGRNATYDQLNIEKVEITIAPDACDECEPYDGLIVDADDEENRPQYHIQCACMDVPIIEAPDSVTPTSDESELTGAADESDSASHASNREEE